MPFPAILSAILLLSSLFSCHGQLQVGFYRESCPRAEEIVRSVVSSAAQSDSTVAAALLRLHFHDCVVDGCEGSILINFADGQQENRAFGHQGLRGFNVIEDAKSQLEFECPEVVSCADIVAMAARDSVVLSRGPFYEVETGRRDGFSSSIAEARNLPDVADPINVLLAKFAQKGLSAQDLVLLSAAHTIGTTACFFMTDRLFNFRGSRRPDPAIAPPFLQSLQRICPPGGNVNVRLGIDSGSDHAFDTNLFRNIRSGSAVLQSDAELYRDPRTRDIVDFYIKFPNSFQRDFSLAMIKMGRIGVITGFGGEIRTVCSSFN